jgi:HAD superfamily hydrolase (TIGR01509 family)
VIKAIIFDCFGVLYRDNISMLYDQVALEHHEKLKDIIRATDYGFLSREEYYRDIADLAGKTPEDIQAVEKKQHSRDEAMIAYSQTFRPDYKIGMLSNIDVGTMDKLFPEPMRSELFDVFIISGEVGITKPSTEIFELAAARLSLRPEECIMVDDLIKNVESANMVGMHGVLFTSQKQLHNDLERILSEAAT